MNRLIEKRRSWIVLLLAMLVLLVAPAMSAPAEQPDGDKTAMGQAPTVPDEAAAAPLEAPYVGLDYSPYRDGQNPWGPFPTREGIAQDLAMIAGAGIHRIRIYRSSGQVAQDILVEALRQNIKVVLGAEITAGQYDEVGAAIALAHGYPSVVEMLVIGNETQASWSSNPVPLADLLSLIQTAKDQVSVPVTTAEYANTWIVKQKSLGEIVEVIWLQSYPYWNGVCIADAASNTAYYHGQMMLLFPDKPVIVGETGWPSGGAVIGCAQPSEANQAVYASHISMWAKTQQQRVYIYGFADELWRGPDGSGERTWGLVRRDRSPKPAWPMVGVAMDKKTYIPLNLR